MSNWINKSKSVLIAATVLLSGLQMSGCRDGEVANAVGAAAIVGGAIVIANNTRCEGGYRNVCNSYHTYYGSYVTECRNTYDSCAFLVPKDNGDESGPRRVTDESVNAVNWAPAFGVSFDASEKFINVLKKTRAGDAQALKALGFEDEDLQAMINNQLPTFWGLDAAAKNLNLDYSSFVGMIVQLQKNAPRPDAS